MRYCEKQPSDRSISVPVPTRAGTAAVELAFAMSVLVLILFGAIDFGRFATRYIAVTNAARVGAGFGSANPPEPADVAAWQGEVRQHVLNEMSGSTSNVTVNATIIDEGSPSSFKRVEVTVNSPFPLFLDLPGLPSQLQLTRTVSMRAIE